MDKDNGQQLNASVDRALQLLELVASRKGGISLADIVKETAMPKTTAHRILDTLRQRGYVAWETLGERYTIGMKMLETGVSGLIHIEIVDAAMPYLAEMTTQTNETSFVATLHEGEIVYLYKIESSNSVRTSAQLGSRRPVHCTGLGKAILSMLPTEEVDRIIDAKGLERKTAHTITDRETLHQQLAHSRAQGYAVDNEEGEDGLICYAVPVFDYTGRVVGAVSCAGPKARMQAEQEAIVSHVKTCGAHVSRRMGFVPALYR